MKKLIVLFSVIAFAMCPFTPSTGNDRIPSSDGVEEIIFHISGEAGDIYRTPDSAPFTCFLYPMLNALAFISYSISTDAVVSINDLTTGANEEANIVIGSVPSFIFLPSNGSYSISVRLSSGIYYYASVSF